MSERIGSRRGWLPLAGWCAATAAGVAVASVALVPVLHTAVPDAVAPLAADNLHQVATPSQSAAPGSPSPSPRAASHPAAPSRPASPETTPKPVPSRSAVTYQDGWTVITDGSGAVSYLRTFQTGGGQAAIRIVPGTVSLVAATPAAGYVVDTTQDGPTRLVVVFHTVTHSFTVDALWWESRPFAQVSEVGG